jgi:hypothetical protein
MVLTHRDQSAHGLVVYAAPIRRSRPAIKLNPIDNTGADEYGSAHLFIHTFLTIFHLTAGVNIGCSAATPA